MTPSRATSSRAKKALISGAGCKYLQRRAVSFFSTAMHDTRHEPPHTFPHHDFTPAPAPPITMAGVFEDIVAMLRQPRAILTKARQPWAVWRRVVGIYFLAMIFAGMVAQLGTKVAGATNMLDDMRKTMAPAAILLMAGVMAPLWEETAFRLPLAPFHVARVLPAPALIAALMLPSKSPQAQLALGIPLAIFSVVCVATLASKSLHERVSHLWSRHFRWVLAAFTLAFGFAHAGNYTFSGSASALPILASPLLVAPQLVAGLLLAYTRQKIGFWYGVALHSSVNTTLVLLLLSSPTPKKTEPQPTAKPRTEQAAPKRLEARP